MRTITDRNVRVTIMKKTVFVTGATGFVGAYLLRYLLREGVHVRALRRADSPMDLVAEIADKVEWVEGDILDVPFLEVAMQGVDSVYHCAAMVSFDPRDKARMMKVNIEGTANVVNICLSLNINRLLHISSIAALGREVDEPQVNEATRWSDSSLNSNYAISKFRAECEVWRGAAEGLDVVVVNPSVILGSGYWEKGSTAIFKAIGRGMKYHPAGGTGFVDVRDVARASIALMNSGISGERFILNSENMSWRDFMSMTAAQLQVPPPTRLIGGLPLEIFWRVEWLRSRLFKASALLTRETVRNSAHTFCYDNTKIKDAIDFKFLPLAATVHETATQFMKGGQFKVLSVRE